MFLIFERYFYFYVLEFIIGIITVCIKSAENPFLENHSQLVILQWYFIEFFPGFCLNDDNLCYACFTLLLHDVQY